MTGGSRVDRLWSASNSGGPDVAIVIPTIGRPSLFALLDSIASSAQFSGVTAPPVTIVDDRRTPTVFTEHWPALLDVRVLHSGGRGPAAARNTGWRSTAATWIAFLDDDVLVSREWISDLLADLTDADAPADAAGSAPTTATPTPARINYVRADQLGRFGADETGVAEFIRAPEPAPTAPTPARINYVRADQLGRFGADETGVADFLRAPEPAVPAAPACRQVGGSQGNLTVPLPEGRRPTDWERGTAGLQTASWITADMVYRRAALVRTGGFDDRFPRAFREDADLALQMLDNGYALVRGRRRTQHPVRPSRWWASVVQQRGNADDVLMRRLHGPGWRVRANAPLGRLPLHLLTTACALTGAAAATLGKRRAAALGALGWLMATADFAFRRIAPGPKDAAEVARMVVTSIAIPPTACWFWLWAFARRTTATRLPGAVLVDRDGTLVHDVPYNGDPALVRPMPGAQAALDRLRQAGIAVAVISNQSGIGRGMLTSDSVDAVNDRIERLLGPFEGWFVCPHTDADACGCRKPAPGLVHQAATSLGLRPDQCVVIGDIGSDMACAAAAGAPGILVPTASTLAGEVTAAPRRAENLAEAVDLVLAGRL